MFSAASPDRVAENARTRDIACERRIQRLAIAAGVDAAERVLHLAQAARGDGVHLACHLVAQQAGHARDLAEQGVDRAPASGDAQQRLAETSWPETGDRLGVEQPRLGEAGDQHLQFGHLVRRRRRPADAGRW